MGRKGRPGPPKAGKKTGSEAKPPRPWVFLPVLVAATIAFVAVALLGLLGPSYAPLAWAGAALFAGAAFLDALNSHRLSKLEAEAEEGLFLVMDDSNARGPEKEPAPPRAVGKMPRE